MTTEILLIFLGILLCLAFIYLIKIIKNIKPYKCYFDKRDTPFDDKWFKNKNLHFAWLRSSCIKFLGHKVVKIKLLGIFTIYEAKEAKDDTIN